MSVAALHLGSLSRQIARTTRNRYVSPHINLQEALSPIAYSAAFSRLAKLVGNLPRATRQQLLAEGARSRILLDQFAASSVDILSTADDVALACIMSAWAKINYM